MILRAAGPLQFRSALPRVPLGAEKSSKIDILRHATLRIPVNTVAGRGQGLRAIPRNFEADLIVAAEKISVATMTLLIRECIGIVCLCLTPADVQRLALAPMSVRKCRPPRTTGQAATGGRHALGVPCVHPALGFQSQCPSASFIRGSRNCSRPATTVANCSGAAAIRSRARKARHWPPHVSM